jgi:hypothetical protein
MDDNRDDGELSVLAATGLTTAAGIAGVFEATREFVTDHLKPEVVKVEDPDTGIVVLALAGDGYVTPVPADFFDNVRDTPRFRRGTAALTTLDSFIGHVIRFGDDDTVVFANDDRRAPKLTAVLDYHRADDEDGLGEFRHGKHRSTFAFPLSDEWKAWNEKNGTVMSMADFALFLEDRIGDIAIAGDEFPEDVERFININGGADRIADFATLVELSRGLTVYESGDAWADRRRNQGADDVLHRHPDLQQGAVLPDRRAPSLPEDRRGREVLVRPLPRRSLVRSRLR